FGSRRDLAHPVGRQRRDLAAEPDAHRRRKPAARGPARRERDRVPERPPHRHEHGAPDRPVDPDVGSEQPARRDHPRGQPRRRGGGTAALTSDVDALESRSSEPTGRFDRHVISSRALVGNALEDPADRPLWVYVPRGYEDDPEARYPSVYVIQGLTGQLDMWRNRTPFRQNFPELADAMFARGEAPPVIVVWVDCWTSLGGSQFLDSPGTGNYLTYLCDEVVPFVDERYRTMADRDHRGIQGKSSGRYGAMVVPMLRPDL